MRNTCHLPFWLWMSVMQLTTDSLFGRCRTRLACVISRIKKCAPATDHSDVWTFPNYVSMLLCTRKLWPESRFIILCLSPPTSSLFQVNTAGWGRSGFFKSRFLLLSSLYSPFLPHGLMMLAFSMIAVFIFPMSYCEISRKQPETLFCEGEPQSVSRWWNLST